MDIESDIPKAIAHLNPVLRNEIVKSSKDTEISDKTEILKEGQYIKVVPIVLDGMIKVYTRNKEKELLLYYIKPGESCVMSFSSGLKNEPSKVYALTEGLTRALLMPINKVSVWSRQFTAFNELFFQQYNLRYTDLLETINHILFEKLDKRLLEYLRQRSLMLGQNPLRISHGQIAAELGTAREVISRLVKKFENEGVLKQMGSSIKIEDL